MIDLSPSPPAALWIGDYANELCDYALRQHEVHAITFLAHAAHLARTGRPICSDPFRATMYGPRTNSLTRHTNRFCGRAVGSVLPTLWEVLRRRRDWRPLLRASAREAVRDVVEHTRGWSAARFIGLTHQPGSPWDHAYEPARDALITTESVHAWNYDPRHRRPANTEHERLREEGWNDALGAVHTAVSTLRPGIASPQFDELRDEMLRVIARLPYERARS